MKFEIGQRVRVAEDAHDDLYPGATGTITGYSSVYPYLFAPDEFREGDEMGRAIVEDDGGWMMSENELEAIE